MSSIRVFLKSALFTILVPGTLAVAFPQLLARYRPHPQLPIGSKVGRSLGGVSIFVGSLLYFHTVFQFGTEGEGTPSPTDEPGELVTGGIYSYTRNPMYIGVLLVVLGQAFWHRSVAMLWWGAGMLIGFHNRIIGYEEPHLAEKHGETYEEYCEQVPRWLPRSRSPR